MSTGAITSLSSSRFVKLALNVRLLGLDFDGVMTDNRVYVFEDGREAVRCSRLEGHGLRRLMARGVAVWIISTETNQVVSARARKLGVPCVQGVEDKAAAMQALQRQHGLDWLQSAFLGNDVNDLSVLSKVALPGIVADAHEDMLGRGFFQTRRSGGDGAVREFCDAIATASLSRRPTDSSRAE